MIYSKTIKDSFIIKHISSYACGRQVDGTILKRTIPENEFFAECFAEYVMSKNPRKAARIFSEIIGEVLGH